MKTRYRIVKRGRNYYSHDKETGARLSLETKDKEEAKFLIQAKNQALSQPALNLGMARTYLLAKSPQMVARTWGDVMADKASPYERQGEESTRKRWQKICRSEPFKVIVQRRLIETDLEHFLAVLRHAKAGTSTNVWLRILHNYALDMMWLLAPVLGKKMWPKVRYKERRGLTVEEHQKILTAAVEESEERHYYELLWETGGSQTDIATLKADRVDWQEEILFYRRAKTQHRGYEFAKVRLGTKLKAVLEQLPRFGYLFPAIAKISMENRARMFRKRCHALDIKGVTLHSYRYAWAERARTANVPLRVAMETLGHQSRTVHQAYAKKADADLLPLEYYEQKQAENIVQFRQDQSKAG